MNWNEIYNKLFKLINEQGSNYFSGERFISIVQEVDSDFPTYSVYIKQREINGESTTRKDFFRDIFLSLTEDQKLDFAKRVEKETHSPLSKSSQELYFLLYGKLPENAHNKSDVSSGFNDFFAELYGSKPNKKVFRNMDTAIDSRKIFVVHGRNGDARNAMFRFLRSIGLSPLEWSEAVELTGKPSPYIGEILEAGFSVAQAVLILFTPDDEARLRENFRGRNEPDYEIELTPQARPNVIFEAGMAMGMFSDRTVLVEFGELRPISDISGRHVIRLNNSVARRQELANRLKLAKCAVNLTGTDWHNEGDFEMSTETPEHISQAASRAETTKAAIQPNTRNLRIKKTFSDLEKDEFESNAFEFIANYFQTSLQDLENSNSHIKTRFRRVDANHFTATVYINDAQANTCSIRFNNDRYSGQGITYSHGRTSGNDISNSLSVVDDGYQMFLRSFFDYSNENKNLTFEEAAEHYWEKFITPLQQ